MSQKMVNRGGRRSGEMVKACAVCESLDRTALEEALRRGAPYKELTKQFKVSIGSMRRHRKGHLNRERGEASAPDKDGQLGEPVYLRFGALPKSGRSWNNE